MRFVAVMDRSLSNQFVRRRHRRRRRHSRRLTLIKNREKYKRRPSVHREMKHRCSFCIKRRHVHHENRSGIFQYRKSSPPDSRRVSFFFLFSFSLSLFLPLSTLFLPTLLSLYTLSFSLFSCTRRHIAPQRASERARSGACGRLNPEKLLNYETL